MLEGYQIFEQLITVIKYIRCINKILILNKKVVAYDFFYLDDAGRMLVFESFGELTGG